MFNTKYLIDTDNLEDSDSGGQCDYLPIKGYPKLGFKSFGKKHKAQTAFNIQKKLSRLDLAPKLYSGLCRLAYYYSSDVLEFCDPNTDISGWGFVTEKASLIDINNKHIPYQQIQNLVDQIKAKTKMKFWDCHEHNIGYVKRGRSRKMVCIDTGKESFQAYANAWGFEEPGPKCPYCFKYQCKCSEY